MFLRATTVMLILLVIAVAGCQATAERTAGDSVDDGSLTTAVHGKLSADRPSNFTRVDVDTNQGVVNLSGIVPSLDEKVKAAELAREVPGVRGVNNNLQVERELAVSSK